MKYKVYYSCCSHIGKRRSMNQDNFCCNGKYMRETAGAVKILDITDGTGEDGVGDNMAVSTAKADKQFPISGCVEKDGTHLFAVFDGMGGEERGEKAAQIAAECAAKFTVRTEPIEDLKRFCREANEEICRYAMENDIPSMGTTAAILLFTEQEIYLCNIGDSKVFRISGGETEQISIDDYVAVSFGKKPALSQNLGIPAAEMLIEPHLAKGQYHDGDIYLLCSDGLTDMIEPHEIGRILRETEFEKAAGKLLDAALENGGTDNITIILCRVERKKHGILSRLFG